jgi:hypothetical protein
MNIRKLLLTALITICCLQPGNAQLKQLKVSANKRFFQTADGKPFFWLGDTGWLLFVKCNREDAKLYLDTRKAQGYNVIQAMVLHDFNNTRNVYGDSALHDFDVSRPDITTGSDFADATQYDFWDHVDFIVDEAAKRGIYMALVPNWGSTVKSGRISEQQAGVYAKFLAERYGKRSNIIWLNGGDIKGSEGLEIWNTIGSTLRQYDKKHLITFHPRGRTSSSDWFHTAPWLDFNLFQSGHKSYVQDTSSKETRHFGEDNWRFVNDDYALKPVKPTLDGEPSYEAIPHGLHDSITPYWQADDIRRYAYWSVFAGGAGFTYGHNAVMQFYAPGQSGISFYPKKDWKSSLTDEAAVQMKYLKKLMETYSYFDRVPAQDAVMDNGERYNYVAATRGSSYAMFYTYTGRDFKLDLFKLKFSPRKASWFSPSTGEKKPIPAYRNSLNAVFNPPGEPANGNDWVLILER